MSRYGQICVRPYQFIFLQLIVSLYFYAVHILYICVIDLLSISVHICVYVSISVHICASLCQGSARDQPICIHICAYVVCIHLYLCVLDLYQCIYDNFSTFLCISVHISKHESISVHMCVFVCIANICQYLSIFVHL